MSIDWQARKHNLQTVVLMAILTAVMALTACAGEPPPSTRTSYAGPIPPRAVERLGRGAINWLVPSPDGAMVAAAGDVGLELYDAETLEETWSLPGSSSVAAASFSGDGTLLGVGLRAGTLALVDAESGEALASQQITEADNIEITAVAMSPTQSEDRWALVVGLSSGDVLLTTASQDGEGRATLAAAAPLTHLSGTATALSFSPDSATFATGDLTGTVTLWDTRSGELIGQLNGHEPNHAVTDLAWADDETLISAGKDGRIVTWDVAASEPIQSEDTNHSPVLRIGAWTQGDARVGAAHEDGSTEVWANGGADPVSALDGASNLRAAAWSPGGDWLITAAGDGRLLRWPVDGNQIGEPAQTLIGHNATGAQAGAVAWSPDGDRLATGMGTQVLTWDAASAGLIDSLDGHDNPVDALAWSPDGGRLASASRDRTVVIWDIETGEPVTTLEGHTDAVAGVAWSPDGERVATVGSLDDNVIVWDAASGERLHTLTAGTEGVWSIDWQPGGETLAVGTTQGTVDLWDASSGGADEPQDSLAGLLNWVSGVVWSPDGTRLAAGSGDTRVMVWNAEPGTRQNVLAGHTAAVLGVAFSPDGERLATGGDDGQLLIWPLGEDEPQPEPFAGHTDGINAVDWSPDGERLASASDDGTVIIWDVAAQ